MRRSHLRRTGRVVLLISALFVLAACGSGTPSSATSASTPHATPRPTTPVVPSHLVHFSTSDHVQLAGLLFGHGKTAVVCSHELNTTKAIWSQSRIVPLLALRGYMVLAYDFRGNGDSAGQADTGVLDVDLRAAIAFVRQQGARVMLRGIRTTSDMESEFTMSLMNLSMDPEIETVFLMAKEGYSHVSGTLLRQIADHGGPLEKFLPPPVKEALERRVRERQSGR